ILHIFVPETIELSNGKKVKEKMSKTPYIVILLILMVLGCGSIAKVDFAYLWKRGHYFFDMLGKMFPCNWAYWPLTQNTVLDTIIMSVLGSVIGCAIALPVSFYISTNFKIPKGVTVTSRIIITLFRTLPIMVFACFFQLLFGMGTFSGTLAISVFTLTICTKMMYEYIETVDMGAYEAIQSTGASRPKCIWTAVWPQVKGYFLSTVLLTLESNVKSASILGYVGAGGIGIVLDSQLSLRKYPNLGLVVLVMTVTVVALEFLARYGRRKLTEA
ncbi:MAG: phosphonate ABC transporter, permease protein PhnE, partial [Spirochaetales bacterium]|nr:phosphonate ABC transporter, permease protein PhnE [Candidatus Physcosoma equi]